MQGDELRKVFAANVVARRRETGMTQIDLARRAGITQPLVAQIESAARFPRAETLAALAEALGTSPGALFSTEGIFSHT